MACDGIDGPALMKEDAVGGGLTSTSAVQAVTLRAAPIRPKRATPLRTGLLRLAVDVDIGAVVKIDDSSKARSHYPVDGWPSGVETKRRSASEYGSTAIPRPIVRVCVAVHSGEGAYVVVREIVGDEVESDSPAARECGLAIHAVPHADCWSGHSCNGEELSGG